MYTPVFGQQQLYHFNEAWISKDSSVVLGVNASHQEAYSGNMFESLSALCALMGGIIIFTWGNY